MSRRRYISTDISIDGQITRLGMKYGDTPVLLYTWMIPHADDDGSITADSLELLNTVWPGRRDKTEEDILACLEQLVEFHLILWDQVKKRAYFPVKSFYKYQTYIKPENRRKHDPVSFSEDQRGSAQNTDNQRETPEISEGQRGSAQNTASLSLSLSPSLSEETPTPPARERTWDRVIPESVGALLTVLDAQKPILTTGTDDLVRWHVEGMQWEVVARGLQTAIDLQKPFAYAQAILRGWRQEGKLTLAAFTGDTTKTARPRDKPASRASPEIIPSPEEEAFWQRQYAVQAGGHEP